MGREARCNLAGECCSGSLKSVIKVSARAAAYQGHPAECWLLGSVRWLLAGLSSSQDEGLRALVYLGLSDKDLPQVLATVPYVGQLAT